MIEYLEDYVLNYMFIIYKISLSVAIKIFLLVFYLGYAEPIICIFGYTGLVKSLVYSSIINFDYTCLFAELFDLDDPRVY